MDPHEPEESTSSEVASGKLPDPAPHLIQVALALYLTPIVVIVCAIGGVAILFEKASQVAQRVAIKTSGGTRTAHFPVARSSLAGLKPTIARDHRRIRV